MRVLLCDDDGFRVLLICDVFFDEGFYLEDSTGNLYKILNIERYHANAYIKELLFKGYADLSLYKYEYVEDTEEEV